LEALHPEDKKREIIEAAIKRFSHFGIAKTTLSEIADDLQISKANLYYYFQDKWTLLETIVEVLMEETGGRIEEIFQHYKGVTQQLQRILEIKFILMEKYKLLTLNLNDANVMYSRVLDPKFRKISAKVFEMECSMVKQVLEQGIKSGELETIDVLKTSKLYVTTIRGLCVSGIYANPSPIVEMDTIKAIHKQQMLLTKIFVNGIIREKITKEQ